MYRGGVSEQRERERMHELGRREQVDLDVTLDRRSETHLHCSCVSVSSLEMDEESYSRTHASVSASLALQGCDLLHGGHTVHAVCFWFRFAVLGC